MSFLGSMFRPEGQPPAMRPLSRSRPSIVSVLDIGTSKVCCLVARCTPREQGNLLPGRTHLVEVVGYGHQRSQGVKGGAVVDVEAAERSIRQAVAAAERQAGVTVDSLIVNVSCGRVGSHAFRAEIDVLGREIGGSDVREVLSSGAQAAVRGGRVVLHSLPVGFDVDGESGIRDPRGMVGERLGVDMHVVDAEVGPPRNLEIAVNRAHLAVDAMVATPFASGLAALVEDEARIGCAAIDMGGGTTTISVFRDDRFVFADAVAVGGSHVTMDLARGLSTRLEDAERLKVLHAYAQSGAGSQMGDNDTVAVPPMSDDDREMSQAVPRGLLAQIVTPRVEEIFELIRDRLARSGLSGAIDDRVVLTGGASGLAGVTQVAERVLGARVRLGRPLGIAGMPRQAKGAAFTTATGLLIYPQVAGFEEFAGVSAVAASRGPLTRAASWLRTAW